MSDSQPPLPRGRARLSAVIQSAGDVVRIADAQRVLDLSRTQAAKVLSAWCRQGWLRRIGTGIYVPVPIELLDANQVVQDAWILVPVLFAPAYIGGRTAAEYWDLTEQIFRDIVVFTSRDIRTKTVKHEAATFTLKHVRSNMIFGTKTLWRGQTKILISDPHRTIVDMLSDPSAGAGIQHTADCFHAYMRRPDANPEALISYAEQISNGAIFKRLGFLAEHSGHSTILVEACKARLTKGYAKLDPAMAAERLITRWRLWVPARWQTEDRHD